jgi:hypothetical protein
MNRSSCRNRQYENWLIQYNQKLIQENEGCELVIDLFREEIVRLNQIHLSHTNALNFSRFLFGAVNGIFFCLVLQKLNLF